MVSHKSPARFIDSPDAVSYFAFQLFLPFRAKNHNASFKGVGINLERACIISIAAKHYNFCILSEGIGAKRTYLAFFFPLRGNYLGQDRNLDVFSSKLVQNT